MDDTWQRWLEAHPYLEPVARVEERVEAALAAAGPAPAPAEPDWEAYLPELEAGVPLLHSAAAALDAAPAVAAILEGLVPRLADAALPDKLRRDCHELAAEWRAAPGARLAAVRWALSGGEGAAPGRAGLVRYLAWRAAAWALAPVVARFAGQRDESRWGHAHCPTCGALPVMAWLAPGDGARERKLACGRCRTRWAFERVGCPYCGGLDPSKRSILAPEGEGGLRLDVCEECRGYLKTFAGEGDPSFLLSDWTSLHLDVLARDRGFQRKGESLYEL